MKIFAYGSNLHLERLRARVPSARFIGVARLAGHQLRFHKRGRDGSAKADAFATGREVDCVWGAVFECPDHEKPALDSAEGVGSGYIDMAVPVKGNDGEETVRAYIADPAAIDDALEPFSWYLAYVVDGAVERGLPAEYIAAMRNVTTVRDPDAQRERENLRVIEGSRRQT